MTHSHNRDSLGFFHKNLIERTSKELYKRFNWFISLRILQYPKLREIRSLQNKFF